LHICVTVRDILIDHCACQKAFVQNVCRAWPSASTLFHQYFLWEASVSWVEWTVSARKYELCVSTVSQLVINFKRQSLIVITRSWSCDVRIKWLSLVDSCTIGNDKVNCTEMTLTQFNSNSWSAFLHFLRNYTDNAHSVYKLFFFDANANMIIVLKLRIINFDKSNLNMDKKIMLFL